MSAGHSRRRRQRHNGAPATRRPERRSPGPLELTAQAVPVQTVFGPRQPRQAKAPNSTKGLHSTALIAGGCLFVGGLLGLQGYLVTLDPTAAVEAELIHHGWFPNDYEQAGGGYEGFLWGTRAHGEFVSTRPAEPGRLNVTVEKASPLKDWQLVSFEFVPASD